MALKWLRCLVIVESETKTEEEKCSVCFPSKPSHVELKQHWRWSGQKNPKNPHCSSHSSRKAAICRENAALQAVEFLYNPPNHKFTSKGFIIHHSHPPPPKQHKWRRRRKRRRVDAAHGAKYVEDGGDWLMISGWQCSQTTGRKFVYAEKNHEWELLLNINELIS